MYAIVEKMYGTLSTRVAGLTDWKTEEIELKIVVTKEKIFVTEKKIARIEEKMFPTGKKIAETEDINTLYLLKIERRHYRVPLFLYYIESLPA
jgi:hypothetical protein